MSPIELFWTAKNANNGTCQLVTVIGTATSMLVHIMTLFGGGGSLLPYWPEPVVRCRSRFYGRSQLSLDCLQHQSCHWLVPAILQTIRILTNCAESNSEGRVPKKLLIVGSWHLQMGNIYPSEVRQVEYFCLCLLPIHKLWPWWRQSWCLQQSRRN